MVVRIVVGDCREMLASVEHADVVITDPVWPNCPTGLLEGHDRPAALLAEALLLLPSSVRRLVVVLRSDSDPRFLLSVPTRWPFVCLHAMRYAVPMYLGRVLGGTEIAYCFGEPVPSREGRRVIPMWSPAETVAHAVRDNLWAGDHPCPRSMTHMRWLVNWWSEPGETVLDPFCGVGSIPLAAHQIGRVGVGIEINPAYVDVARRRIANDAPLLDKVAAD